MHDVTSIEQLALERGMQQGIQQGIQQALRQGIQHDWLEGWTKGWAEGWTEGQLKGATCIISRQLTRRFGPPSAETQARLKAATLEQLELWAENILDAATLEDVFKNH